MPNTKDQSKGQTDKTNDKTKKMAIDLLHADTENEVIQILKENGYWNDPKAWRLYGDKEGNWASVGNQQASAEAALVEKIINSCDSRLLLECKKKGIEPESSAAPKSLREAVSIFFEGKNQSENNNTSTLIDWAQSKLKKEAEHITVAATGGKTKAKRMSLTIADLAEGQSAERFPETILSLNAKNKQRIHFVQGKFNMGGSGALRFCGQQGLQLVISRRHPELAKHELAKDSTVDKWAVTVVRREEPTYKDGEAVHSEFTYLAPVNSEQNPKKGSVLSFEAKTMPLFPEGNKKYTKDVKHGTAIKLYEYKNNSSGQSNVLMKDGLLYSLERLMPEIALPIRIHECRDFKGKDGSFETTLAGLVVRLENGKGGNVENGFPITADLRVNDMEMTARIYAFKKAKSSTYLKDEGIVFTINGQSHGYLSKAFFTRKKVNLSRLKDSLLVLIDCSKLSIRNREDLFMTSRDKLSKEPIRYTIEEEIQAMLKDNEMLKQLRLERQQSDLEAQLKEEKPLEEVLGKIFKGSPTLRQIFGAGSRLSIPFSRGIGERKGDDGGSAKGDKPFVGKTHPTFFHFKGHESGKTLIRNCEKDRRVLIKFETDVENEYFVRSVNKGKMSLEGADKNKVHYSSTLTDGVATLNMKLSDDLAINDTLKLAAVIEDETLTEPFVNNFELTVIKKQERQGGNHRPPKDHGDGKGDKLSQGGIALPKPIPVHKDDSNWKDYNFTDQTSCHVISEDNVQTFYINMDNRSLLTEMKHSSQHAKVLEAKFKYANILLGLGILHESEQNSKNRSEQNQSADDSSPEDVIRRVTEGVAPVLIPMIDSLSDINEDQVEEYSEVGEDG